MCPAHCSWRGDTNFSLSRTARRFDDVEANLAGMVEGVARPVLQEIRDDQDGMRRRIEGLDTNLRKFDEQAARMVTYFNEMTQAMEQRTAELSEQLQTNVEGRLSALTTRFDESESAVASDITKFADPGPVEVSVATGWCFTRK